METDPSVSLPLASCDGPYLANELPHVAVSHSLACVRGHFRIRLPLYHPAARGRLAAALTCVLQALKPFVLGRPPGLDAP